MFIYGTVGELGEFIGVHWIFQSVLYGVVHKKKKRNESLGYLRKCLNFVKIDLRFDKLV